MKTEIEDIIRSTLVIQNKQSIGLCVEKIVKYLEGQKCVHPFNKTMKVDSHTMICTNCKEKLILC